MLKRPRVFLMAGGGTGGHVIPLLAVARALEKRGHEVFFVGTRQGMEAKLVPAEGFPIEWVEVGALKRVGLWRRLRTLVELPAGVVRCLGLLRRRGTDAVLSLGGYAAGPPVLAALLRRIPVVVMEPNAVPGFTNRKIARWVARALISFEETARWFPPGRCELTGLPVREEFFRLPPKVPGPELTVLITGGSRGARSLNRAVRESWPLFRGAEFPVRLIHQAGAAEAPGLQKAFAETGLKGEVTAFIEDMPAAFAQADLVVCRAGAGAVAELAAAGKPAVLVPFPFAADDHQLRNAQALERAGAARIILDRELTGRRLFEEVAALGRNRDELARMGERARKLARPGAAERAAEVLEEVAERAA